MKFDSELPNLNQDFNNHMSQKFPQHMRFFTDGSRCNRSGMGGFGIHIPDPGVNFSSRVHDNMNISICFPRFGDRDK